MKKLERSPAEREIYVLIISIVLCIMLVVVSKFKMSKNKVTFGD